MKTSWYVPSALVMVSATSFPSTRAWTAAFPMALPSRSVRSPEAVTVKSGASCAWTLREVGPG
ncbi:hypothetical protein EAX62_04235 [Tessaracoccus antarcticus]|uniref:Secreted protein n=1 Tax=Tessaracoccus antarcticus TaxID=2479848 RepID=A0A3M0GWT9_9ACTN|nr:hypothetical protein EAX62_04235 [Tessaracoccus antarcticus]